MNRLPHSIARTLQAAAHPAAAPAAGRIKLGLGTPAALAFSAVGLIAAITLALSINSYYVFVLAGIALVAIVGIGLNVLIGLTGQVSFGHVGFYAVGAYTVAILTTKAGLSFWLAWPLAAVVAGALGVLLALPALRVKGPYLAMITIAFSFIIQHAIIELRDLTGGQNGIMGLAAPAFLGLQAERAIAVLGLITAAVVLAAYCWLSRGSWGAAMRAVRDSETAAESIGLNPLVIKTVAFALSAALAGLAGGLFAPLSTFVTPDTFSFMQSILFVLVVVLGGSGSILGPVIGAVIVGALPELLSSLEDYRLLFFGALLLLVLWVAPDGVTGLLGKLAARLRKPVEAVPAAALQEDAEEVALPVRARRTLAADGLTMVFGGVRAVSDLGFEVPGGAVTSLIGPNGAGKTTALNMLSGFYRPSAGQFTLGQTPLAGLPAFRIARHGVARTYQTSQLFGSLTVADNVALACGRGSLGGLLSARGFVSGEVRARCRQLLDFCGYRGALDIPSADLAHVDRRLVEIARALAADPDVLLLDEPAAGLSREDKTMLAQLLTRIAEAGISVVVVEHDMELVMQISRRIVVLDAGQRLAIGTPQEVQNDPAVRKAYLGEGSQQAVAAVRNAVTGADELLGVGELVTGYGAEPVLHGINLQVRQGEMIALLGANGAGKSTLMRSLAGLHRPVQGGIHAGGVNLMHLRAEQIVRHGVVLVPEGRQVFPELSVLDNIRLGAFLYPQDVDARVEEMLGRFPRLRERLHHRAGLLSGGEQQMLAIARGLMSRPRVLLLDEPSLGLAPKVIAELFTALDQLRRENMTIVLVDQMAALALSLADRAYVIEGGRVVAQGTAAEIAANDALAKAYLGAH
ncbi:branched-chain amino acid ABC transporter ATP-binding protein/permease [Herbaspirillum huttiense]|uniref:branched-chain amino acid ABC transporter ATP-binding protein/permease n=1 Tax=Herbaspirillum huttiense TaxID=863372 RepID=UPI002E77228E|nr:branched-chain amino acid ABC transporter ATP-binding protein/permease [Herbaspirillum huttiense]MEE1637689.1 branched-chain amino acid ABC transporter ATP-binding protein/permease [Herbaspirillum huttiense NC40101]